MANGENGNGNGNATAWIPKVFYAVLPTAVMVLVAWMNGWTDMRSDQRVMLQRIDALTTQVAEMRSDQRVWIGKIQQETLDRSLADEVLRGKVQECIQKCR